MNEQIKAIRAEIKRLQKTHEGNLNKPMERGRIGYAHGVVACCDKILSFIDSLPEEPDKSLEEAVEKHINEALFKWIYDDEDGIEQYVHDSFIAGAEWQAKQGYSFEYIIQYDWGVSDTSTESKKVTLSFPLPADIFEDDRVIVQIRKK